MRGVVNCTVKVKAEKMKEGKKEKKKNGKNRINGKTRT